MNLNATFIFQTIVFLVLVWFIYQFILPPLVTALDARRQKIAEGLALAETSVQERDSVKSEVAQILREARLQAAEIVTQAQTTADGIVAESRQKAEVEADKVKVQMQTQLDQQVTTVRDALRAQVVALSMQAAQQVLKKEIDSKSHAQALDDLVAQL